MDDDDADYMQGSEDEVRMIFVILDIVILIVDRTMASTIPTTTRLTMVREV